MVCIIAAYAVMRCMSVCLSVWVSVTFVYSVKTSKQTSNFCHHLVAMHIHNFSVRNLMALFRQGPPPPNKGVVCRWAMKKSLFSISVALRGVLSTVRPSDVMNRLSPDRGKLVTLIGGVCVQHSSNTRVTVSTR